MKKMLCFLLVTVLLISSFPVVAYANDDFQTWEELIDYYRNIDGFSVYQTYDYHGEYDDSGMSFTVLEGTIDGVKYSVACKPWTGEDRWTDSHELSKVDSLAYVEGYYGTDSQITIPAKFLNHFDISWNPRSSVGLGFNTHSKQLESIKVSSDNKYLSSENGVLFNKDKTILLKYPAGKKEESYNVPQDVTSIGAGAFSTSTYLKHLTLPENFQEIKAYAFADCSSIETLYSDGVTSIGRNAFNNCTNLKSVEFNGTIESIGFDSLGVITNPDHTYMFLNCDNLESVIIPHGTASIPDYFLEDNASVKNVVLPDHCQSIGKYALTNCAGLESINIPNSCQHIGEYAFLGCFSLQSMTIPESVTEIETGTFYNCSSLNNVNIGKKTTRIGHSAFCGCSSLQSIILPDTIEVIESSAFYGCNLQDVIIPAKVKEVLYCAYMNNGTKQVILNDNIESIGDNAFVGEKIKEIEIPDTVQSIGRWAFGNCWELETLALGNSVETIGESAFIACDLKEVVIPDSVKTIGDSAFADNNHLKNFTIGKSVSSLGTDFINNVYSLENVYVNDDNEHYFDISGILFDKATNEIIIYPTSSTAEVVTIPEGTTTLPDIQSSNLKVLNIPTTVTSIGKISNSENLESINVAEGNPVYYSIGGILFSKTTNEMLVYPRNNKTQSLIIPEGVEKLCRISSTELKSISIPASVNTIEAFDVVPKLEKIEVSENNQTYCVENDVLYTKDFTDIIAFPPMSSVETIVVPKGITEIGGFAECKNIKKVVLPDGVKVIKSYAFVGCSNLSEINLPEGITDLGYCGFAGCSSLTEITIPSTVEMFGGHGYAFGDCTSLKKVTLSDGLKIIGAYAFYECTNLNTIVIPKSMERIGTLAFLNCKNITDVYYKGSEKDWNKIVGNQAFDIQCTKAEQYPNMQYAMESTYLLGDSDGDDSVTIVDATVIQRHLAEIPTAVYIEAAADADQDGSVTIIDATCIQRSLAELPTHEGIGEIFV